MSAAASHSVLLVDDERFFIASLLPILQPQYTVYIAINGQQALARARAHRPDAVLLDIQLPDMDGLAVCRTLKAEPALSNTPVIFLSASTDPGIEADVHACGGNQLLRKPVDPDLLQAVLADVLTDPPQP